MTAPMTAGERAVANAARRAVDQLTHDARAARVDELVVLCALAACIGMRVGLRVHLQGAGPLAARAMLDELAAESDQAAALVLQVADRVDRHA